MSEESLSQLVRQLISDRIDSVVQLEVLLLLVRQSAQAWTARAVSETLRIDAKWAAGELTTLRARGLIRPAGAAGETSDPSFQYSAETPAVDAAVQELARAYADRRVAVVGFICSKPMDKIQTFADAFRLRGRGKQDG